MGIEWKKGQADCQLPNSASSNKANKNIFNISMMWLGNVLYLHPCLTTGKSRGLILSINKCKTFLPDEGEPSQALHTSASPGCRVSSQVVSLCISGFKRGVSPQQKSKAHCCPLNSWDRNEKKTESFQFQHVTLWPGCFGCSFR